MATFIQNVQAMTDIIRQEKARTHLSEPTLIRVIEMNLSMMMNQSSEMPPEDEDGLPIDTEALDAAMTPDGGIMPPDLKLVEEATTDPTTEDE